MAETMLSLTLNAGAIRFQRALRMALVAAFLLAAIAPMAGSVQSSSTVSVILQGPSSERLVELVRSYYGSITARLPIIQGIAAEVPSASLPLIRESNAVTRVTLDHKVQVVGQGNGEDGPGQVPDTDYPEVVNSNFVWGNGYTGAGIGVAVLDTGFSNHKGLNKGMDGRNRETVWVDMVDNRPQPGDANGHGTHVAGIIANSQVGPDGSYGGIAPGVTLVGVRVLGDDGSGTYADAIEGLQWVIENKDRYNIRVVNMSLYAPVTAPYWADPLDQAVTAAWANGLVVVAAAGNTGETGPMSVGVPGNNPYAITVGAFTDNFTPLDWSDDYLPPFSASGPTLDGFVKPDVVAPGGHMVAPMSPGSALAHEHRDLRVSAQYFSMAGTSQATGVVSGIVALMLSFHPDLTPDQVKFRLLSNSIPQLDWNTGDSLYSVFQQGAGRVSAPDAVFGSAEGTANTGMDINADLAGMVHYEGYAYYDTETGTFRLRGMAQDTPYTAWAGGYATWAGGYATWAGGYATWAGGPATWAGGPATWAGGYATWAGGPATWAGGPATWAGGPATWAGGPATWAGGPATWAGGPATWAGGYATWAGGPATWAGGPATWAGGPATWAGSYGDPAFAQQYAEGGNAPSSSHTVSTNRWVGQ